MADLDIIFEILQSALLAYPNSVFIKSLNKQYQERGGLSKKQLEGLYQKAEKIPSMHPGRLATLQAIIMRKPNRYKSEPTVITVFAKDENAGKMISDILAVYPEHKRGLFLKAKYDNNETLASAELSDLERLAKLLKKKD